MSFVKNEAFSIYTAYKLQFWLLNAVALLELESKCVDLMEDVFGVELSEIQNCLHTASERAESDSEANVKTMYPRDAVSLHLQVFHKSQK